MSMDAASQKSISSVPVILEKIAVLDKWVTARLEETRVAEARIEQKLEHLGRLEGSLQNMIDSLRKQMLDTVPVIHQANQAKEQARQGVEEAISDAVASARQQVNHLSHAAADQIDAQIKDRIAAALASVSVEQMAEISRDVQSQLADEAKHCREQAEQTLVMFRQLLQQQVEQVRDQAAAAARPYVNRITEARDHVDRQIDAIMESAQSSLEQRLAMLSRSAQSSVELMEYQLVHRVKTIRPQVMHEVESTQTMIAHRVAGLVEASKKMVSTIVNDLDAKLSDLPPRAESLREELDQKVTAYLNEMQDSAMTMVGWLEDRVSERVDDLVEKSRRSMWGELRALNNAADRLAAETPVEPSPAQEHPMQPLSLTMYVDRLRTKTDPKPAA